MKKFLVAMLLIPSIAFAGGFTSTNGRKVVTTAGTAVPLSASAVYFTSLVVCAETDNTGNITVGKSTVVAALATRAGIPLSAGDCYDVPIGVKGKTVGDLQDVYIDSTVNGDGVTYQTIYEV
jgi:hypothetical protein